MSIIALQKNKKLYKFMYNKEEKQNLLKLMTGKTGLMFGGILPEEIEEHILSFLIPYKNLIQEVMENLKWTNDILQFIPDIKYNWIQPTTGYLDGKYNPYFTAVKKSKMIRFEEEKQIPKEHSYCQNTWQCYECIGERHLFKKNLSILRAGYKKTYLMKNIIPYFFQFTKIKGNRKHIWIHPTTGKHYEKNYLHSLINNDESNDYIMPKYHKYGNRNTALIKLIMSF